jgi:hypothetical protein
MKLPVKGHDNWYRDSQKGSFDNANTSEYNKYMAAYNAKQQEAKEKEALQNDVSQLKSEMSEIKSLLLTLVQNKENTL